MDIVSDSVAVEAAPAPAAPVPAVPLAENVVAAESTAPAQAHAGAGASSSSSAIASLSAAIDLSDFERMAEAMRADDEKREQIIKRSREALKASKSAGYSLLRRDFATADQLLEQARALLVNELLPLTVEQPSLRSSLSGAIEEYCESVILARFLKTGELPLSADDKLSFATRDEYLGGVLDFAGELGRWAVLQATDRKIEEVKRARDCVDTLYYALSSFDLRNGNLRRKTDALRWTRSKMETLVYELTLSAASGMAIPKGAGSHSDPMPPPAFDGGEGGEGGEDDGGGDGGGYEDGAAGGGGGGAGGHRGGRGGRGGFRGGRGGRAGGGGAGGPPAKRPRAE